MTLRCYLFAKSMNFTFIIFSYVCWQKEDTQSDTSEGGIKCWQIDLTDVTNSVTKRITWRAKQTSKIICHDMNSAECLFETWGGGKLTYFLITTAESFAKQQEFFFSLRPSLCVSQNSATLSQPSNLLLWPFVIIVDLTEHQTTAQWSFLSGNFFSCQLSVAS